MLKKLIATLSVLSLVVCASANEIALVPVDYVAPAQDFAYDIATFESEGWATYDLVVDIDAGDSWTVCYADATSQGFFQHPNGGNMPNPSNFNFFGLAAYDSFWTSSEEYPNPDADANQDATSFAPGNPINVTDTQLTAEWYVDPEDPNVGEGVWTIARYTVPANTTLVVEGDMYYASTLGAPNPYHVEITPEPGSLALLALGGLALIRRR